MAANPNLQYMLSRTSAVTTQTFKLNPQNSTSASANSIIRISLPSNTLLNLKSLKLLFRANCEGGTAGGRLPAKIDSLIDRVTLEAGGVTIAGGLHNYYGVLRHAKDALTGSHCDPVLSHPEMVREKPYHNDGAAITTTGPEVYAAGDDFCISHWEGFLGSAAPSIIDTALLPDMVLVIHLADNNVLSSVAGVTFAQMVADGSGAATFALSNIRLTCECIGLGNGVYDSLLQRSMSERGMLEICYTDYVSTTDTHANTSRFHCSASSLDRIWVVFRQNGYDTQGGARRVKGYKEAGCFTSPATIAATNGSAGAVTQDIGKPEYDIGGLMRTNGEKYRGKFHNFAFGANTVTAQLQLNGALTPGFPATIPEWYAISKNSVDVDYGKEPECYTLDQYRTNFSVICHRLCLPGSSVRSLSGQDTRGISLQGSINTTNVPASTNVTIFLEKTSVLQIGAGKQFDVVG